MTKLSDHQKQNNGAGFTITWSAVTCCLLLAQTLGSAAIGIAQTVAKMKAAEKIPARQKPPEQINFSRMHLNSSIVTH